MTWRWPRLLVLLALLMMPLGMAAAPASAPDHQMMAGMAMGHCPYQAHSRDHKGGLGECTIACAAALPAIDGQPDGRDLIVRELVQAVTVRWLPGLHPETATPSSEDRLRFEKINSDSGEQT